MARNRNETARKVGALMRKARLGRELNQEATAELIGVSHATLRSWEHGETEPGVSMLSRWAEAVQLDQRERGELAALLLEGGGEVNREG